MQTQLRNPKKKSVIKKFFMGLASICLLLLGIGVVFEAVSNYFGVQKYPAPGKLVDVGGYNLHLNKHGEGKPVIILETGSGASSTIWGDMPEKLAAYGTVVTYDRGGYGWSEKAATERSGENIVNELYTALKNEGLEGPYILVGHSLGGMYTRLFAQTFPYEVAGLILLDTRPEDFSNETEPIFHEAGIKNAVLEGTPSALVLSVLKTTGIIRAIGALGLLDFPTDNMEQLVNIEMRSKTFQVLHEELENMPGLENAIRGKSLGDLPITIVTHGIPIDSTSMGLTKQQSEQIDRIWQIQQKQMLNLSTNSRLVIAEKSGHSIMIDEPKLVVREVKKMVEQVN